MNHRRAPSVAEQRLQLLVVAGLVALYVAFRQQPSGQLGVLVGIGVMAWLWPPAAGWRPLPIGRVLAVYLPFAALWLGITIGYLQLMSAIGSPVAPQPGLEELGRLGLEDPDLSSKLVLILVLAPVFEEIIFRGYLFGALRTLMPAVATQLATAVLFGLAHGWQYAFPIAVLALLFGWLRGRYDALLPSIVAHAVHNGFTVGVTLAWPETLTWMYPS